jgi:hypothetical protein
VQSGDLGPVTAEAGRLAQQPGLPQPAEPGIPRLGRGRAALRQPDPRPATGPAVTVDPPPFPVGRF